MRYRLPRRLTGAVWLIGEVLTVAYDDEPLAQYQVKYARESGRIAALTEERIYPPRFPSPQPYLWTLDDLGWHAGTTLGAKSKHGSFPEHKTVKTVTEMCSPSWVSRNLDASKSLHRS